LRRLEYEVEVEWMTWKCRICGKHGFGSQSDFIIGTPLPNKQRYLGDICYECLSKLLDVDSYEVEVILKKRRANI
jgi:hypothetical protein